ncbi:MAG TPA: hypothetical protein EYP19_07830 [Desulfobacterales bacterium]|nr:hypothetical protein [Desulfobacterales bacterium]
MEGRFMGRVVVDKERKVHLPEDVPIESAQILEVFWKEGELLFKQLDRKKLVQELAEVLKEGLAGTSYQEIREERLKEDKERQAEVAFWEREFKK